MIINPIFFVKTLKSGDFYANIRVIFTNHFRKVQGYWQNYREVVMHNKNLFVSVSSDTGTVRKKNQDNFYINGEFIEQYTQKHITADGSFDEGVFAVADGMGGESFGEVASNYAVSVLRDFKAENGGINDKNIDTYIEKVNNLICDEMTKRGQSIGTTVAIANIKNDTASFYNVGDSKCFHYRNGAVKQMTKDHSVVANLVEIGVLTPEQAKADNRRHQLSQALGVFPDDFTISPFISEPVRLQPDDAIIICSDGLTDALDEGMIADIISNNKNPYNVSNELVFSAMHNGSKDNVTAVVIFYKRNYDLNDNSKLNAEYDNDATVLLAEDNKPELYENNRVPDDPDATISLDDKISNKSIPDFAAKNVNYPVGSVPPASFGNTAPPFVNNGYPMVQNRENKKKSGAVTALLIAGCIIAACTGFAAGIIVLNLFFYR